MPRVQKPNTRKLRDGTWAYRVRAPEGYRGSRRPQARGFRTEHEAFRAGLAKIDEMARVVSGARAHPETIPTMFDLVDEFLTQYVAKATKTKKCLTWNLNHVKKPTSEGGLAEIRVDRVTFRAVSTWRAKLPPGSAWHYHKSLRQLLNYAVEAGYVEENIAAKVDNPKPKKTPAQPRRSRSSRSTRSSRSRTKCRRSGGRFRSSARERASGRRNCSPRPGTTSTFTRHHHS
jgi:Phage integrase SAM-like domain